VTGLTFGTNVTFSGLTGLTFTDNITGQLPQSRISGIAIPASNVTNGTFPTVGLYTFKSNLTVQGNITGSENITALSNFIGDGSLLSNLNATAISQGFLPQSRISGITIPAGNVTNTTYFQSASNYTFQGSVHIRQETNTVNNTGIKFYSTAANNPTPMCIVHNGTGLLIQTC
jgi:hypothetical protein